MLQAPDMWEGFADRYLDALDQAARGDASDIWVGPSYGPGSERKCRNESGALRRWRNGISLLLDRLDGPETGDRLDRLVTHPALEGPERKLLQARLTQQRGDRGART